MSKFVTKIVGKYPIGSRITIDNKEFIIKEETKEDCEECYFNDEHLKKICNSNLLIFKCSWFHRKDEQKYHLQTSPINNVNNNVI